MRALFDEWLKLAEHVGIVCVAEKRVVDAEARLHRGLLLHATTLGTDQQEVHTDHHQRQDEQADCAAAGGIGGFENDRSRHHNIQIDSCSDRGPGQRESLVISVTDSPSQR